MEVQRIEDPSRYPARPEERLAPAFRPRVKALGLSGIRQHDLRRTCIAIHVEAGTHPKIVQDRVGHSAIRLTMEVCGKIAGKMKLSTNEQVRLGALAGIALSAPTPDPPPGAAPQSLRKLRLHGRKRVQVLTDGDPKKTPPDNKLPWTTEIQEWDAIR